MNQWILRAVTVWNITVVSGSLMGSHLLLLGGHHIAFLHPVCLSITMILSQFVTVSAFAFRFGFSFLFLRPVFSFSLCTNFVLFSWYIHRSLPTFFRRDRLRVYRIQLVGFPKPRLSLQGLWWLYDCLVFDYLYEPWAIDRWRCRVGTLWEFTVDGRSTRADRLSVCSGSECRVHDSLAKAGRRATRWALGEGVGWYMVFSWRCMGVEVE